MKILDRAAAISAFLTKDKEKAGGTKALPMQQKAIKAILGGIGSEAWRDFMTILASNEDQLKRLTGKDDKANELYVRESSAYAAANSTCGGQTPDRLPQFLDPRIDDGLPTETDPNFVRVLDFELTLPVGDQPV